MKFLILGDIVGSSGVNKLSKNLSRLVKDNNIDSVIVNGENSALGKGIRVKEYDKILSLGVDVITMGNHLYYRKEMTDIYKTLPKLVIPANITNLEGNPYVIFERNNVRIAVINLIGEVGLSDNIKQNMTSPFKKSKELVEEIKTLGVKYIFVDFHAEATAEKIAMGYYLENDVTCLFGTHTHVQTSDEAILNNKMAYITDIGMVGPKDSVLGLKREIALRRFASGEYLRYECSDNDSMINGIIVETDDDKFIATSITRIFER